jgi:hypothetical protein
MPKKKQHPKSAAYCGRVYLRFVFRISLISLYLYSSGVLLFLCPSILAEPDCGIPEPFARLTYSDVQINATANTITVLQNVSELEDVFGGSGMIELDLQSAGKRRCIVLTENNTVFLTSPRLCSYHLPAGYDILPNSVLYEQGCVLR